MQDSGCMMCVVAPEVGLAGQAVRDGRRARAARLGGAAAGVHGGPADAHRRLPHHLQAAARPLPALPAGARPRGVRRGESGQPTYSVTYLTV